MIVLILLGLEPSDKVLTAWVAIRYNIFFVKLIFVKDENKTFYFCFSSSKKESGCLRFIPESQDKQANL